MIWIENKTKSMRIATNHLLKFNKKRQLCKNVFWRSKQARRKMLFNKNWWTNASHKKSPLFASTNSDQRRNAFAVGTSALIPRSIHAV